MLFLVWILNFFISLLNAAGVGYAWNYTKLQGGFAHFMNWCVAAMASCGFTWCILIPIAFLCHSLGYLNPEGLNATLELGYVVIIPVVLGAGLVMTIDSWVQFYKKPGLLNGGVAAWNTFAQVRNATQAATMFPKALDHLSKVFSNKSDRDNQGKSGVLIIFLVVFSLLSGILLTRYIIIKVASLELSLPKDV